MYNDFYKIYTFFKNWKLVKDNVKCEIYLFDIEGMGITMKIFNLSNKRYKCIKCVYRIFKKYFILFSALYYTKMRIRLIISKGVIIVINTELLLCIIKVTMFIVHTIRTLIVSKFPGYIPQHSCVTIDLFRKVPLLGWCYHISFKKSFLFNCIYRKHILLFYCY